VRLTKTNLILVVTVVLLGSVFTRAQDQSWKAVAPVGDSFRVTMPTEAVEFSRVIPLNNKDSVRERVYQSVAANKRYLIASFTRTTPDRVPALSTLANFMTGIQQSFQSGKDEPVKSMTYDRDISSSAGLGKQYRITIGDYLGTARFLETDKAFYALMVIGGQVDDSDVQRFLSSFALTEGNTDSQSSGVIVDIPANAAELERLRTSLPPEPWPRTAGPIIGGVLNGKATSLPVPEYPKVARKAHESGTVEVEIIINEQGYVVWAQASDGPPNLKEAAVAAAWKARFTPTRLMGQPVKVRGRIIYNFVAQ